MRFRQASARPAKQPVRATLSRSSLDAFPPDNGRSALLAKSSIGLVRCPTARATHALRWDRPVGLNVFVLRPEPSTCEVVAGETLRLRPAGRRCEVHLPHHGLGFLT